VSPDLIPAWLRWARYLCSLTYSVRIGLVEEFSDRDDCVEDNGDSPCQQLMNAIEADPDDTWW
jgi:hypothetical protein